ARSARNGIPASTAKIVPQSCPAYRAKSSRSSRIPRRAGSQGADSPTMEDDGSQSGRFGRRGRRHPAFDLKWDKRLTRQSRWSVESLAREQGRKPSYELFRPLTSLGSGLKL